MNNIGPSLNSSIQNINHSNNTNSENKVSKYWDPQITEGLDEYNAGQISDLELMELNFPYPKFGNKSADKTGTDIKTPEPVAKNSANKTEEVKTKNDEPGIFSKIGDKVADFLWNAPMYAAGAAIGAMFAAPVIGALGAGAFLGVSGAAALGGGMAAKIAGGAIGAFVGVPLAAAGVMKIGEKFMIG